jgi:hypothetical protein
MLYHRYASFPVALALCATGGIPEAALALLRSPRARSASAVAAACAVAFFFGACYPPQLARHPFDGKAKHAHWQLIADPIWHRRHKQLRFNDKRGQQDRELRERYAKATPAQRAHDDVIVTGFCRAAYVQFEKYVVHELALTDAVLARIPGPLGRPGHKLVTDVAYRLETLHEHDGLRRGRGMFDRFLRQKPRPRFVKRNLPMLRVLEKKVYNRHDLAENLELALTRIELR